MSKAQFGKMQEYNEQVEFALKEVADFTKQRLPLGMGFTLLMFDFGPGGNMFYISNAQRDDVIESMKEFIAKHEAKND